MLKQILCVYVVNYYGLILKQLLRKYPEKTNHFY